MSKGSKVKFLKSFWENVALSEPLLTERGEKAKNHIYKEIIDLVRKGVSSGLSRQTEVWIYDQILPGYSAWIKDCDRFFQDFPEMGIKITNFKHWQSHVNSLCVEDEVGNKYCTFKQIFDRYVKISDKGIKVFHFLVLICCKLCKQLHLGKLASFSWFRKSFTALFEVTTI